MNELQTTTVNETLQMAKLFAESGMFTDAKQMSQAFVKVQAGKEMGIGAFASMTGINIIMGKPTLGAGLIASCVKANEKYDFKVKELTDKICSIDFFQKSVNGMELIGNSTFTIEDAKKQGTKNLDKFPKNMLYARAISNGQKWFCPDVFKMAVYVPEEMPEQTIETTHVEIIEETKIEQPKISKLNQKQMDKLLLSDIATVEKYLNAIEEGKLEVTKEQNAQINIYLETLKTNNNE